MSAETTTEIIRKAFADPEFRERLLTKPKEALIGYELTEEEREDLENLTPDIFDLELSELEDRISKFGCAN
jgi:hypothetical protein